MTLADSSRAQHAVDPDPVRQDGAGDEAVVRPEHVLRPSRLRIRHVLGGGGILLVGVLLAIALGPITIPPFGVAAALVDLLPQIRVDTGLTAQQLAIVTELRLPRVVLGVLVGSMLAVCGAAYQGVFRNPLADPFLLGSAAGAGLGATIAIVSGLGHVGSFGFGLPLAAFAGSLFAVALTYLLGATGERSNPGTLILAGVAIASFLTAVQTYVQQRNVDTLREVYAWILGRLTTAGWGDVALMAPYAAVSLIVLIGYRRVLDVMAIGDDEASALGMRPRRARLIIIVAASLGTAAAVSVSGLIGFVGVIVPHLVRLLVGYSYRIVIPLSALLGGALLVLADLVARTANSPAEIPIGVVTAFLGAPFFLLLLRTAKRWTS